jgi:AcrR family transcriptional regulator
VNVSSLTVEKSVARPKTITDDKLIEAAYELIMTAGPRALTFERLGQKVGLVPAALVRRFTNKQKLLIEVDRYALARSSARLEAAMARHDSPINAILAGFITELSFASTLERFIHGQEFLLMDFADKDLYANYHASFQQRHDQVAALLKDAQARGELLQDFDTSEVTRLLEMVLHGSGHVWAMTQEGPIEDYINHYVQLALKPYRIKTTEGKR